MKVAEIDLLDQDRFMREEHHAMFTRLRAEDPVHWHADPYSGGGFWNVTKHEDLIEVNRDTQLFSSEVGGTMMFGGDEPGPYANNEVNFDTRGNMMLEMDPPKHTRYRLLVNKGFTPRMIGLIEQALRHRATLIVDRVIERGSADFVDEIASELPLQAIAEILGVPQEDRRKLFEWSNAMIGANDPEYASDDMTAIFEIFAYVNALAAERRGDPHDDIVTKLLNSEVEGDSLTELEFDMFMMLLIVAGNETTRTPPPTACTHSSPTRTSSSCSSRIPRAGWRTRWKRSCAGAARCCTSAAPPPPTTSSGGAPSRRATRS